ncbi:MAG: FkbM family methyltransferase [Phycisphaerae bacterium]|nr:FkbM family methyltransferase [Phycisphaerae bacterium]
MAGEWMFMHPMLRPVALLWGRLELPRYRNVLNRVAGWDPYPPATRRRVRGKVHGYMMDLVLDDWPERWCYFLGRYYEPHTQRLFQLALRPGDTFIDIGANIGMTALVAARLVGPSGRVLCFEPNPAARERLEHHVALNALQRVIETRPLGLADAPGELDLLVPEHSGQATFARGAEGTRPPPGVRRHRARVSTADAELAALAGAPMLLKIDVEGFELRVLRGMARTLESRRPAVVAETIPALLGRAGDTLPAVFEFMHAHRYRAFSVEYTPALWGWPGRLTLRPVPAAPTPAAPPLADDLLWLPVEPSVWADRLGV